MTPLSRQLAGPGIELRAAPDLVIAVLQRRACIRQQTSEALLPLQQRRRTDRVAIEMEEVKHEEDERVGVARIRGCLNQVERGLPIRPDTAKLAVDIRLLYRQDRHGRGYGRVLVRPVQ